LPTLLELAGIEERPSKPVDGMSQAPWLLRTANEPFPKRHLFSHWAGKVSVRDERFRLDEEGKLYDLLADPGQTRDVTVEHAARAAELVKAVADWRSTVLAELRPDDRPFTVGFGGAPLTQLPARDGLPHGGVERSARAPNCSYFTHWTSTHDRMTWNIEVGQAGLYQATLHYTCRAEDAGATVELSLGERRTTAKIDTAFDPSVVGAAEDRVPRQGESYVKEFRELPLGAIELPQGRGELTLRATNILGQSVADVRGVTLRRANQE
jgi:hypothetical protein